MEVITFNFVTPLGYKNHGLPGENEIKKMSMLRRQAWMADDDEFDTPIIGRRSSTDQK